MKLSLSQRDATWPAVDPISGVLRSGFRAWRQRPSRSRIARLRRRGPQWAQLALVLLVADVMLAVVIWIIVEIVVG